MKSKEAISKRLNRLRLRYAKQYIKQSQERCHTNCVFNHEQAPLNKLQYKKTPETFESSLSPRRNVTLLVLQEHDSVHFCTYGSEDPSTWNGLICDDDSISRSCKVFRPKVTSKEAREEFIRLLSDDAFVLEHYRDIATLQWVLENRIHEENLSILDRIALWWTTSRSKPQAVVPQLPESTIPDDLWDNSSKS